MASDRPAASLRRNVNVAFGVAVLVLAATGGVSIWSGARSREAARARAGSEARRTAELRLLSWLTDAETGQRGYLLTGQTAFLAPYLLARDSLPGGLARLDTLVGSLEPQAAQLAALRAQIDAKLAELSGTVALGAAGRMAAARRIVASRGGKALMDRVRATVAAMVAAEDRLAAGWDARLAAAERLSRDTDTVVGALAIAFLLGAAVVINRDMAKRRRAEQAVERIFALSPDLMVTADDEGRFRDVNPTWERQLGFTAEELRARPFLDFVHPDDRAATVAQYEAQQRGEEAVNFANRYRHKDGSYRWLEWNATPFEKDGLIHAVARDVTERRRAEAEIRSLNAELARSVAALRAVNQELEAFTYSVSHDLRAPLRHVSGFADLLERHAAGALDERGRHYVETIRRSARHMGELIDDLLAFSRIGRAQLVLSNVALDEVVRDALAEVRQDCGGREVAFALGALPTVRGDRSLLRMVMTNLLSNAVKYTRPRARAEIEVGASAGTAAEAVVYVRDNGVGFDMKYADKLFGVFQRLHGSDEFEGTGIGLATVQRIVHRLGGRAWAEGVVDRGATFYVALPGTAEAPGAAGAGGPAAGSEAASAGGGVT
jgi:PAS domain S-box-containing protein